MLAQGCKFGARRSPLGAVQERAAAREASSLGEFVARFWRRVSCVACLMCPALLRVAFREGLLPSDDNSSEAPPLGRLLKLRRALPVPVTPGVAAFTSAGGLRAFGFFGLGRLFASCCAELNCSALVAIPGSIVRDAADARRCRHSVVRDRIAAAVSRCALARAPIGMRRAPCWCHASLSDGASFRAHRGHSRARPTTHRARRRRARRSA